VNAVRGAWLSPITAGRIMVAVAVIGVVVGVVGTVVGWRLAGSLRDGVDESLFVATESLVTVDESITVVSRLVTDLERGLRTTEEIVQEVSRAVEQSSGSLDAIAASMPRLAEGITTMRDELVSVAGAAETLEGVITAFGRLPGIPPYRPAQSLSGAIREAGAGLDPVIEAVQTVERGLTDLDGSVAPLLDGLARARNDLEALADELAGSQEVLDQYRESAQRASLIATEARSDLGRDLWMTRVLVLLAGLTFTAGQIVPFWVGQSLLAVPVTDSR
jgi:hypothetical protein